MMIDQKYGVLSCFIFSFFSLPFAWFARGDLRETGQYGHMAVLIPGNNKY